MNKKRFRLSFLSLSAILATTLVLWQPWSNSSSDPIEVAVPSSGTAHSLTAMDEGEEADESGIRSIYGQASDDLAEEDHEVLAVFEDWVNDYLAADSESVRSLMVEEGMRLAEARRPILKNMIRNNPKMVIEVALPADIREALPESVQGFLGRPVSGHGSLGVYGVVPPEGIEPDQQVIRRFETGDERFEAFVYGGWLAARTKEDVFLHGIAIEDHLAVDENPIRFLSKGETEKVQAKRLAVTDCPVVGPHQIYGAMLAETSEGYIHFCGEEHAAIFGETQFAPMALPSPYRTIGEFSVLVIRVDFAGVEGEVVSEADAYNTMLTTDNFFRESSYRQFSFRKIHVTSEVLRMTGAPDDYLEDPGLLLSEARQAAMDVGYVTEYDFEIVAFPGIGYSWAGLGAVGARGAWVQGGFTTRVVAHELGHNMGLFHADYWRPVGPFQGNYPMDNAQKVEYGNMFDAMGGSLVGSRNHFSGHFKNLLGWLPEENVHTLTEEAEPAIYRIHRLDGGASLQDGRQYSMRIVNNDHLLLPSAPVKDYWIDFRQLFIDNPRAMEGVFVQWGDDAGSSGASHLLNMNYAGWPALVSDAALGIGETFSDPFHNIHITPVATGGLAPNEFVDVAVTRGVLSIRLLKPLPEPSAIDPVGAWVVPQDGTVQIDFFAEATSSPLATIEVMASAEGGSEGEFAGIAEWVEEANLFRLELPMADFSTGLYRFQGVARNELGNEVVSDHTWIRVVTDISIVLNANTVNVFPGQEVLLEAIPSEAADSIMQVEFFVNDVSVGAVESAPFRFSWVPTDAGEFTIRAIGFMADGREVVSEEVRIEVADISISLSASPSIAFPGQEVLLEASLLDEEESIARIEFFVDHQSVGVAAAAPFHLAWVPATVGEFVATAVGLTADERVVLSNETRIEVAAISMSVSATPSNLFAGEQVRLEAVSLDGDDSIARVEFFVNRKSVGAVESAPFLLPWVPASPGEFVITALGLTDDGRHLLSTETQVTAREFVGFSWRKADSGHEMDLLGVASDGESLVAVGVRGTVLFSRDGISWEDVSPDTLVELRGVAFGNGKWTAVGGSGTILSSDDGTAWEFRDSATTAGLRDVTFGNGLFVAVGDGGRIRYSTDGSYWVAAPSGTASTLEAIASRDGLFVAGGQNGVILTSSNGVQWVTRESGVNVNIWDMAAGAEGFSAVGNAGVKSAGAASIILTSADGENWTRPSSGGGGGLNAIHFAHGVYLMAGFGGNALISPDLDLFREETLGTGLVFDAVTATGETFVLVGRGGAIVRSVAKTYAGWLADSYSAEELADPAFGLPSADPAGTGASNLLRYALGIDGRADASERLPRAFIIEGEDDARLVLNYVREAGVRGVHYAVEVSTDLVVWQSLEESGGFETVVLEGNRELVQARDVLSIGEAGGRRFLRLRVKLLD